MVSAMGDPTMRGTSDPLAAACSRGAEIKRALLADAGGGWSVSVVAQHLGIPQEVVKDRGAAGVLLVVELDGQHLYPACQFGEGGMMPYLEPALRAFQVESAWTQLSVLLSDVPIRPGTRVIDALRSGLVDEAMHAISTYGEQGAL
jgi:hypothetical protein